MNPAEAAAKKQQERETLRNVIAQWNANRLDLFELSEPNEELEFHGVMRFYFQDSGQKVATKCIRVASDATTQAVIETLIEKFRADMRMLSLPEYALYEIHENGDERRLGMDENPLLVQLNWHMDDREGRFLLRRIDDKTHMPSVGFSQEGASSFRRKLSKREKKQLKKQEKINKLKSAAPINENDSGVAEKLYIELPETSFTRSISNPEAVMRRRRQQKLERKLQQFRSKDGGPDTGGTLKIYGESLCQDVPYKTLLLSVRDTAQQVVKEMLAKYGLEKEMDPHNYCLVQVNAATAADSGESKEYHGGTNNREYILDDDECPLAILMNHPLSRGSIMFHVRRRPADYHPRKRKKKLQQKWNKGNELQEYRYEDGLDRLPFFLELNPDGTDINNGTPKKHQLHPNVTEVGSERLMNVAGSQHGHQSQSLQLFGPNVQSRHCVIANTEGIVTVTPCSGNAETYVNGQRIYETTILQNGAVVKFGRIHNFRFLDPSHDDRTRQRHDSARQPLDYNFDRQSSREDSASHGGTSTSCQNINNGTSQNYETTFDVDGNVETVSTSSLGNKDETRSQRSVSSSRDGNRLSNYERYPRGTDPILPAVLEFREETEEAFLHAVISDLDPQDPYFKLAPTYTLYLVARYRASTHYRPELTPTERAHRLTVLLARVAAIIHTIIQERYAAPKSLAFWMANSSELLHFLKSDRHISAFSLDAQDILSECVQIAFRNLVSCLQGDVAAVMPQFMSEREENLDDENTRSVLQVLTSTMALLRRCRVNAALTIQLFSQLFHFVNMWAFNKVVTFPTSPHVQQGPHNICYCTKAWGVRLKTRLARLEAWAERQGLELAADCHLARIIQAAHLLQAPKYNAEDLSTLSSTCFKLNSLQLRALLSKYQSTPEEPRLPQELIENVVRVAENVADELARSDGREIRLEEDAELQLPFLLPEDGYSCDVVRGVPQGLAEFLAPLQQAGLCRMTTQPTSSGLWTIYMTHDHNNSVRSPSSMSNRSDGARCLPSHPEVQVIKLHKSASGMGLSIVAAKGAGQDKLGIYIKSVVKGGAADVDGQLQAGDQLLKVDGQSLVGITQEKAAEYLVRTGSVVVLEVGKQGAIYHGLATLLQQPSPVMTRGPRRMSERDLPSRIQNEHSSNRDHQRNLPPIQSSKSVPSLSSGNSELVHTPLSPITGSTDSSKQHEVFNPGYSRTSSTNSIPQKTFEAQPQCAPVSGLRSKSNQNLHDPRQGASLSPTGAMSRQSSNPTLHSVSHQQHGISSQHHINQPQHPSLGLQSQPSYQYHNNPAQNQQAGEVFYQNLSMYRNEESYHAYPPPSPSRTKFPSPQAYEERSPTHQNKNSRGSQSSLHRPPENTSGGSRDRPASSYIPHKETFTSPQHGQNFAPRSQSSRDILRQGAKLHEMQEEVRRRKIDRDVQGVVTSPQHYAHQPVNSRPQMVQNNSSHRLLSSNNQFTSQDQPNHHGPMAPQSPGFTQTHPMNSLYAGSRPQGNYAPPTAPKPTRQPVPQDIQRLPFSPESRHSTHPELHQGPLRPPMPPDELGYRDSPPPPPPPTSTHPLYQSSQKVPPQTGYTASMGEPPKGTYYPASTPQGSANQQPIRQYQFNATNPWEREEREKEQQRRRDAARAWRDHQIAELSNLSQRSPQQEEQLRALKLEKEFQKRAEEAAHQDEDEEGEDDQESLERVQGLLRITSEQQHQDNLGLTKQKGERSLASWDSNSQPNGTTGGPLTSVLSKTSLVHLNTGNSIASDDKECTKRLEEIRRKQIKVEQEEKMFREAARRRDEDLRHQSYLLQSAQHQTNKENINQVQNFGPHNSQHTQNTNLAVLVRPHSQGHHILTNPNTLNNNNNLSSNNNHVLSQYSTPPTPKLGDPSQLRLDNLVINGPASPSHHITFQSPGSHQQYNGYLVTKSMISNNGSSLSNSYQHEQINSPPTGQSHRFDSSNNFYENQSANNSNEPCGNVLQVQSGAQRLDSLLSLNDQGGNNTAPQPPERGSSFTVMSQTHSALRNSSNTLTGSGGSLGVMPTNTSSTLKLSDHGHQGVGTATIKRVSFHDPNANQQTHSQTIEQMKEDPNHFINEAEGMLSSPKSPDSGSFLANTPGVIGAQEVYKDPRTRMLAQQQQQKSTRAGPLPEKLSFKEKMKMFAMETGENGTPRDKVKISRAQREIDGLSTPTSPNNSN